MKKNRMMRLASVLMVLCLMTTSVISGTFAKYTSTSTGSDTARVAKWSITVEGTEIGVAGNTTVAFDLFSTVKSTAGATEENVKAAGEGETPIIAPGTSGSFEINIVNASEVNAKYTIALTEDNENGIPLQYSVDGSTWVDSVAELAMDALTDVEIAMANTTDDDTATQTVFWRWVFDANVEGETLHEDQTDVSDTLLGYTNAATVTITATITVTQVD